ncbi:hypothetical protein [Pseudogulbenkiania sp. MAI-1]|uniref:hypothetical protein n=1 Tax=Pseudogulbenkiania sp. MAI-1 TaxID=990370 RepID=UPI00045E8584|nr:hypothetical protein [Pseudogulbenkiania sp. MAI-1]
MKKIIVLAVMGTISVSAFADDVDVTISGYMRAGVQVTNDVGNTYFKPLGGDAVQSAKGGTSILYSNYGPEQANQGLRRVPARARDRWQRQQRGHCRLWQPSSGGPETLLLM